MTRNCRSSTPWTTKSLFSVCAGPPRLTLASWSNCLAIQPPCAALSLDVRDPGEATGSVVLILVAAAADLDHPGAPKVDAARMVRIGHQRTSASLDAGTTQRLAGVHFMPGGGAVVAREETACAQPDEKRAVRVLRQAVHARAGEAGACGREGLPAVERANHLPEARAGVDHLRIAPIHEQRAEASRLTEILQRLTAVGRLEQAGIAAVGAHVEHVRVRRINGDRAEPQA